MGKHYMENYPKGTPGREPNKFLLARRESYQALPRVILHKRKQREIQGKQLGFELLGVLLYFF